MSYRPYHTLIMRDSVHDMWRIEFGAYDRNDVVAERNEYVDNGHKRINTMIIETDHTQAAIESRVKQLNTSTTRRI